MSKSLTGLGIHDGCCSCTNNSVIYVDKSEEVIVKAIKLVTVKTL